MKKYFLIISGILIGLMVFYFFIFWISPSSVLDFYINQQNDEIYLKIKPFNIIKQFTFTKNLKTNLFLSPDKKFLAFYENIREPNDKNFDKEWTLKIINLRTLKIKTIFIGNYHTSDYQWMDNKTIRVFVDAGTGVDIYRDIDINVKEPFIASEHMSPEFWTPMVQN